MNSLLKKIKATILIVEDDAINSSYLSQVISNILPLSTIFEAASYDATAAIVNKSKPDLIFMDYYLPGKHGIDIAKEINALPHQKKIPIILFTSHTPEENSAQLSVWGIYYLLRKPANIQAITNAIEVCFKELPSEENNEPSNNIPDKKLHFNKEVFFEKIGNDNAFASMLFNSFIENFHTQAEGIKSAYNNKDNEKYLKNIHHLKGEAGTLCFEVLHELLNHLEVTAFDCHDEISRILEDIASKFYFLKRNINNFYNV